MILMQHVDRKVAQHTKMCGVSEGVRPGFSHISQQDWITVIDSTHVLSKTLNHEKIIKKTGSALRVWSGHEYFTSHS